MAAYSAAHSPSSSTRDSSLWCAPMAPRNPQFEMLRPSRMSLPESMTKSTSSRRIPEPLSTATTASEMRSTCWRSGHAVRNCVCALATTATRLLLLENMA